MSPGEIWHLTDPVLNKDFPDEKHFALIAAKEGTMVDAIWICTRGGRASNDSVLICKENYPKEYEITKLPHTSHLIKNRFICGDYILDPKTGEQIGDIKGKFKGFACGKILEAAEEAWGMKIKIGESHPDYKTMKDQVVGAAAAAILAALKKKKK